jgi:hypothetical protein
VTKVDALNELLQILNGLEADSFDGITTSDDAWFHYLYESSAMLAKSPGDAIPRTRKEIDVKKTIFSIFFANRKLVTAEYLPKGQKYNQYYFISGILPELERGKMRYKWREQGETFYLDIHHSKSHYGGKIQEKFDCKGLVCCHHPLYSLGLSPCDFGSMEWRRKNEGSRISHRSRLSPPFDGDLE